MKVLFVNPIIYTPENAHIPQIDSIDDTMSYDLCMAFQRHGVDITLAAAEEWKPRKERDFPFPILWMKSSWKRVFPIHRIPVNLGLITYLRTHRFDMVITSEVFSMDTLASDKLRHHAKCIGFPLCGWKNLQIDAMFDDCVTYMGTILRNETTGLFAARHHRHLTHEQLWNDAIP